MEPDGGGAGNFENSPSAADQGCSCRPLRHPGHVGAACDHQAGAEAGAGRSRALQKSTERRQRWHQTALGKSTDTLTPVLIACHTFSHRAGILLIYGSIFIALA